MPGTLGQGVRRFGELHRRVPGVTERVLMRHLRELELGLVVSRTTHDEAILRVEYTLTQRGAALNKALDRWRSGARGT
jgi:DNA-binding HxlR family transcriptional regulator